MKNKIVYKKKQKNCFFRKKVLILQTVLKTKIKAKTQNKYIISWIQ